MDYVNVLENPHLW